MLPAERTPAASTKATPPWVREEDASRHFSNLEGREGILWQLFQRAEASQKDLVAAESGLWLCHVTLLVPESGAEGLVPFSDPDVLLKGVLGARSFVGFGSDDRMAVTIPIPWVQVKSGDRLAFEVFDRDIASADDLVGKLEGRFAALPVELKVARAAVTCRGTPESLWATTVEELFDELERARAIADASKRTPGAIAEGYPMFQVRDMKGAIRLIGELAGFQHPYVAAGDKVLTATLARLASEFPQPPPAPSASSAP